MHYKVYLTSTDEKTGNYQSVEAPTPMEAVAIALNAAGLPESCRIWKIASDRELNELERENKKMAAKKDFTKNATRNKVLNTIAEATQEVQEVQETQIAQDDSHVKSERKTYTEQEIQEFQNSLQTSGRKGVKLPRINMAFTPEIYEYIKSMARACGMTITEFVNHEMKKSLEEHRSDYEKILAQKMSL